MLAFLYHLIGDADVYTLLDRNQEITLVHKLVQEEFLSGDKMEVAIQAQKAARPKVPVALITGKLTASAGEDIAVAFRGRDKVRFIGEPSAGYLSGNDLFDLPFGIQMALTTGLIADPAGHYTENIVPDILIEKQDNFKDLLLDKNIQEALGFFKSLRE